MAKIYDKWRNHAKALFIRGEKHIDVFTNQALWDEVNLQTPKDVGIDQSTMTLWKKSAQADMEPEAELVILESVV